MEINNINKSINDLTNAVELLSQKSENLVGNRAAYCSPTERTSGFNNGDFGSGTFESAFGFGNKACSKTSRKMQIPLAAPDSYNGNYGEFSNFLRSGENFFTKGLASNSSSGSLLMPEDICIHVYQKVQEILPLRKLAKTMKISTDSLDVIVDEKSPDAGWTTETQYTPTEESVEFKKIKISTHEIFANLKITQKLLDDSNVDIYNWFLNNISEKIARVENKAFWSGDGNGKPKGILSYKMQEKEPASQKFQCFKTGKNGSLPEKNQENLFIDVASSLKHKYLRNACWIMSRSAYMAVQHIKDDLGYHIFQSTMMGLPTTILGYPVYIDDDLPELESGKATCSIVFGDFKNAYTIVDRTCVNLFRDPYSSKPFVEFFATKRTGGDVINFDALKIINFGE